MTSTAAASSLEEQFMLAAAQSLPVNDAEIGRTEYGYLSYYWRSPCEALGGLRAYVTEHEIMLSTKISHSHVDEFSVVQEQLQKTDVPRRLVELAVGEIASILNGEIAFTEYFDAAGERTFCGSGPRQACIRRLMRNPSLERAWDWSGEILIS